MFSKGTKISLKGFTSGGLEFRRTDDLELRDSLEFDWSRVSVALIVSFPSPPAPFRASFELWSLPMASLLIEFVTSVNSPISKLSNEVCIVLEIWLFVRSSFLDFWSNVCRLLAPSLDPVLKEGKEKKFKICFPYLFLTSYPHIIVRLHQIIFSTHLFNFQIEQSKINHILTGIFNFSLNIHCLDTVLNKFKGISA